MTSHVWCHGPYCHTYRTTDRVRGSKGNKALRTRKIKQYNHTSMYSYFCSNGCYNDFANKYVEQVINIAPRHEPLHTPIDRVEKTTHTTSYGYTYTNTRIIDKQV